MLSSLQDPRIVIPFALAASAAVFTVLTWLRRKVTPEELEHRRRITVNRHRRTIEGFITEADSEIIHYQYELRGVTYFASQDIKHLLDRLPPDPSKLIGPVSVRFEPKNPANSIVVCEEWSGLSVKTEWVP